MTYDPNQPRDPAGESTGGQWSGGQLDAIVQAARKAAGVQTVEDKIMEKAAEIADSKKEYFYAWDPKTGTLRVEQAGDEKTVDLTLDQFLHTHGAVTLHNHPAGNEEARFSMDDLKAAASFRQAEMRVVAGDYIVAAKIPHGWKPSQDMDYQFSLSVTKNVLKRYNRKFEIGELIHHYGDFSMTLPGMMDDFTQSYKDIGLDVTYKKWR